MTFVFENTSDHYSLDLQIKIKKINEERRQQRIKLGFTQALVNDLYEEACYKNYVCTYVTKELNIDDMTSEHCFLRMENKETNKIVTLWGDGKIELTNNNFNDVSHDYSCYAVRYMSDNKNDILLNL